MHTTIGIICLNEEHHITINLRQHYPLADSIIIVEGADRNYPARNVTSNGFSTDRTAEAIRSFPDPERKITFIQHGWTRRGDADAKAELRNRYAELAKPGLLAVVDADEFYTPDDFATIMEMVKASENRDKWAFCYPFVHFWHSTSQFITGGYYDIGHTRFWRWEAGMRYAKNHNFPERNGRFAHKSGRIELPRRIVKCETEGAGGNENANAQQSWRIAAPCCYHLGFARDGRGVRDKTDYYINRGERVSRPQTIVSREAWFAEEENGLPKGHKLWRFGGSGKLPGVLKRM